MIGTFAWLILTSARNRLRLRIARLRNPRYAIALALGLVYVWGVYLRPASHAPRGEELFGPALPILVPVLTLGFVAWTWLFGGDRSALVFTEAEVAMLFTAPVSRRTLLLYKIARSQLAILTTSVVWTVVFRQGPTLATALAHVAAYWVMLSTLNLNRLGAAMVRANAESHGLRGVRRTWLPLGVFVAGLAMVVLPVIAAFPRLRASGGFDAAAATLATVVAQAPASWALAPFTLLTAPLTAAPGVEWARTMAPALLLLTLMIMWVLRTDVAFEETAAEASTQQARRLDAIRERRHATAAKVTHPARILPLAATGRPAVALVWKNAMWIVRTGQLRGLLAPPTIGLLLVGVFGTRSEGAAMVLGVALLILAVTMLLIGPLSMRNDLRGELQHLSLVKTLPLRGRDIVLAEVASGALPLAAMQLLLGIAALLALSLSRAMVFPSGTRLAALVTAPVLLLALNGAAFVVHNGIVLLFPGWSRLGTGGGGGIETMGLGMITLTLAVVMLLALAVVPALSFAIVLGVLRDRLAVGLVLGGWLAGLLLLAEVMLVARVLGGMLERLEPMAMEG